MESTTRAERYARNVIAHPYFAIMVSVLVTLLCVGGVRNLGLSTDYRAFFSEENPQLLAFEALQDTFSKNDNIFFVIRSRDGEVFTPAVLSAVKALTHAAWQIPYSMRVDSLTNFQHVSAHGDELVIADLVADAANLSSEELDRVKRTALSEPRLVGRVVSEDARTTAVNVTLQLPGESRKEVPKAVAVARNLASDLVQKHPHLDVRLTGNVLMSNALSEASMADMKSLVPAMYGVIIVIAVILLRSLLAAILVSIVIGLSTLSAVGLAGWAGTVITPPSASAPTVIMTLAVAGSIHVLTTFLASMRNGVGKREAVLESLRLNMEPVLLTSLTTAIGFLSMNFSDTPPLRDLGNISAAGIVAAFFYTVFLLPALMVLLPFKTFGRERRHRRAFARVGDFVVQWHRSLVILMAFSALVLIALVPRLELNDQYVNYFDQSFQFRRDTDFAMEHLTGIYKIEYVLGAGESGGVSNPEYLRVLEAFMEWYRSQPEVVHVHTIAETMKTLNKNMHGDDSAEYRLPENRELAAQYLLLYEMSLPYGLDLNTEVSVAKESSRFTVMVKNISTKALLKLEQRAQEWLQANAPATMRSKGTGSSIIFAHMSERSIRSMIAGTALAIFLIGLVLIAALRSFKYGLLSFVPNLLPAVVAIGIWAVTVGELGFALSVMFAMTLGIVVDDTIHFLTKYVRGRRQMKLCPEDAVRYAFSAVGFALVTTTVVLVAGFLVLAQSGFLPNSGMAALTVITITVALIIDFFLVPPLLVWLEGDDSQVEVVSAERLES